MIISTYKAIAKTAHFFDGEMRHKNTKNADAAKRAAIIVLKSFHFTSDDSKRERPVPAADQKRHTKLFINPADKPMRSASFSGVRSEP